MKVYFNAFAGYQLYQNVSDRLTEFSVNCVYEWQQLSTARPQLQHSHFVREEAKFPTWTKHIWLKRNAHLIS